MRLRAVRIEPGEGFRWKGYKGPAIRRPLSLTKPRRTLERAIRRDAEAMARRVAALLREEEVLGRLDEDARQRAEKRAKGPTGRGGRPLGPQRTLELERVFDYEELQTVARLFSDEERAFALELETTLEDAYEDLFELGGQAARRALGVRGSFNLRAPGIADALAERANQLAGNVSDDVFERLKTVLADQFYLKGKHPFEVAAVLEEEFDWMSRSRAELIARTESGAVTEEAQFITYEASGVPFKRWLTTLDGREREDHFDAHGQIRAIDEPFDVGGEELMYPLDPAGSAKQVCNCRCTQIPVIGREQFLDESTVWDGENDPDEFAKEKRAKRTRVFLRQATKHLPGEHDQETHGRGGGGGESESESESSSGPSDIRKPPAMSAEQYAKALAEVEPLLPVGQSLAFTMAIGGYSDDLEQKIVELGPAFFAAHYAANETEQRVALDQVSKAWLGVGGQATSVRFAAQDAFGFPRGPVWDEQKRGRVEREDSDYHQAGQIASMAGAMRVEWEETQSDLSEHMEIGYDTTPTIDDFLDSEGAQDAEREAKEWRWKQNVRRDDRQSIFNENKEKLQPIAHEWALADPARAENNYDADADVPQRDDFPDEAAFRESMSEWANAEATQNGEPIGITNAGQAWVNTSISEEDDAGEEANEILYSYWEDTIDVSDDVLEAYSDWAQNNRSEETLEIRPGETITVHRGVNASESGYVSDPVESWSVDEATARRFGSTLMTQEVPRERVFSFYAGRGGGEFFNFGGEYEFMVLPDVPAWYRRDQSQLELGLKRKAQR